MPTPLVSFVVPCYKLAHLLPECIDSILHQTYKNLEILVMDDCSPDDTAATASAFHDARIRYIRNNPNIGHLRNYNKGISLSRGKYVWLISADDYLRKPHILDKYVGLMEAHPEVGYTFCPGVGVRHGRENGVLAYSVHGPRDRVLNGRSLLRRLLPGPGRRLSIVAASGMVRRECYEKFGMFPLQTGMEWSGDWYLWCLFALFSNVGYFAEPMVCYREHTLSMTNVLTHQENIERCAEGDIAVPWMIRQKAIESGQGNVARYCLGAIAHEYVRQFTSKTVSYLDRTSTLRMSSDQLEASLAKYSKHEGERNWIRSRVVAHSGDKLLFRGDLQSARRCYLQALKMDRRMMKVYFKLLILPFGKLGFTIRRNILAFRMKVNG